MDYTTTALLASVRRRAMLPVTTTTGNDTTDLLATINDVLQEQLVPKLLEVRSSYLVAKTPRSHTLVAGTSAYRIPARAVGNKLRDAFFISSAGSQTNLPLIDEERREEFALTGGPVACFLSGPFVVLVPTPALAGDTLRLTYYLRPSEVVALASCGAILTISANRLSCTIATNVTLISAVNTALACDIVKAGSPFDVALLEGACTASGTTVTFGTALTSDIEVGDYICQKDQTPVPNIPAELHPALAQMTVCKILENLGDTEGHDAALKGLSVALSSVTPLISPRIEGETEKVIGGYTRSVRRSGGG